MEHNRRAPRKWYGSGRNAWHCSPARYYNGDIKMQTKIIKHPSLIIYEHLQKEGKLTKKYPVPSTDKVKSHRAALDRLNAMAKMVGLE